MRARIRWLAVHGVVRFAAKRAAAAGDPQAMLVSDPSTRSDPTLVFEQIRARGPLLRTRISNITVDHKLAFDLLRSDDFRVTQQGANLPTALKWVERRTRTTALHPLLPPSLLSVEPPDHTRYRKLVSSVFTVRAVSALRDRVQIAADALLDDLAAGAARGDVVDIVDRYCALLPVVVISEILGVPAADRQRVLEFGALAAPSLDLGLTWNTFNKVETGLQDFDDWLAVHIAGLRQNPGDDLMSQLTQATEDGHGLNDSELRATAGLVLAAGFETTVNLLGSGIKLFLDNPDQLQTLTEDPSHWPNAVDEILRLESPVQLTARLAKHDIDIAGRHLEEGNLVVIALAGANRDPKVFTDPNQFDVTRSNANKHLSFSGGRHFCLGAALARAEAEVGLRTLFSRFPNLTAAGEGTRRDTRVLRGWEDLPVRLAPVSETDNYHSQARSAIS